jgi:hypothetical protein
VIRLVLIQHAVPLHYELHQILLRDQFDKDEMDRRVAHMEETHTELYSETLKGRYNFEDLGVYERIVLKRILKK